MLDIENEIDKILYLYRFKKIIRYGGGRIENISTESDAEHIFGMMILANYFLSLKEFENKYNKEKIYDLILFHEMDELETGDVNTYFKTDKDKQEATESLDKVFRSVPSLLQNISRKNFYEYEENITNESKFVFWIDKIEPIFHLCVDLENSAKIFHNMKLDFETAQKKKYQELSDSGIFLEFLDMLYEKLKPQFYILEKKKEI